MKNFKKRNIIAVSCLIRVICTLVIVFPSFTGCYSQTKYFEATGIINKTEELTKHKTAWTLLKNKERIDGYTRVGDSIFGGEIACNISPIRDADASTFMVVQEPDTQRIKVGFIIQS